MTTYFDWRIARLDRSTADGFVQTAHYMVSANEIGTERNYSSSTSGTVTFERESAPLIPYENLTPEIVIGWVKDKLGEQAVQDELQDLIDQQKTPPVASGLPWADQTT